MSELGSMIAGQIVGFGPGQVTRLFYGPTVIDLGQLATYNLETMLLMQNFWDQILECHVRGLNLAAVRKITDNKLKIPLSYSSYKYFVHHNEELQPA